jgi:hypothetical protein
MSDRDDTLRDDILRDEAMCDEATRDDVLRDDSSHEDSLRSDAMRSDAMRGDVFKRAGLTALKGTGFSPSIQPAQSQRALALEGKLRPEDFYMEGPYLVFTAAYHLRRGHCCNSNCRHCPYQ